MYKYSFGIISIITLILYIHYNKNKKETKENKENKEIKDSLNNYMDNIYWKTNIIDIKTLIELEYEIINK